MPQSIENAVNRTLNLGMLRQLSLALLRSALRRSRPAILLVDVFGTLIVRSVPGHHVKRLASQRLVEWAGLEVDPDQLYLLRREVERRLMQESVRAGLDPETCLLQVAAEIHRLLGASSATALPASEEFCDLFAAVELASELAVHSVDAWLVQVLSEIPSKPRMAVVSDTYLPAATLRRILEHHGIGHLFEAAFASSEYGRTKRSGELFPIVLSAMNTAPSRQIMVIGDDPEADGSSPRGLGLRTFVLPRERWERLKRAPAGLVRRDIARRVAELLRPSDEQDLFRPIALTLYVAIRRLHTELRAQGATGAFFLAREGLLLGRLLNTYQEEVGVPDRLRVAARYLWVSRRATYLPTLAGLSEEPFTLLRQRHPQVTTREFLASLGFEEEERVRLLEALGVGAGEGPLELEAVRSSRAFEAAYERRRTEQREALLQYLASEGFTSARPAVVVDVGWRGSIQDRLRELSRREPPLGLYLGLVAAEGIPNLAEKRALLFANQPQRTPFFQIFAHFKSLLEVVLSADQGSVRGYSARNGQVVPILDENATEAAAHRNLIAPVQERVEARFRALCRELARSIDGHPQLLSLAARHHARMVYMPSMAEIRFIEDLPFYENFGRVEIRAIGGPPGNVKAPSGRFRHLANPRGLVRGGGWPPVRMHAAGLGWLRWPYGWFKLASSLRRV